MNKRKEEGIIITMLSIFLLLFFSSLLYGQPVISNKIYAIKRVYPSKINTGESLNVSLLITNKYDKDVVVKIRDRTVIDGNGYNIQCLERTIPANETVELIYPRIYVYDPGNYTIEGGAVDYKDPNTGKDKHINIADTYVLVKGRAITSNVQKSITNIYRCDGINMQSTSTSSYGYGSSISISTSYGSFPPSSSNSLSSYSQEQDQNIQAVKNMLNKELRKEEEKKHQMLNHILSNSRVNKLDRNLEKEGYKRRGITYNPKTHEFHIFYKSSNGDSAEIAGIYKNNSVERVMEMTPQEKEKMIQRLFNNSRYKKYMQNIKSKGMRLANVSYSLHPLTNTTQIFLQYNSTNPQQSAQIVANITNGKISSVKLNAPDIKTKKISLIMLLFVFLLFLLAVTLLYYFYKKRRLTQKDKEDREKKKKKEHKEKTKNKLREGYRRRMVEEHIKKAEEFIKIGKWREASEEISLALRSFFLTLHDIKREMDTEEVISLLREKGFEGNKRVEEVLRRCDELIFSPIHKRKQKESMERVKELLRDVKEIIRWKESK